MVTTSDDSATAHANAAVPIITAHLPPPVDKEGRFSFQDLWQCWNVKTGQSVGNDNSDQPTSSTSTRKTTATSNNNNNTSVFVRIRPMLSSELEQHETELPGMTCTVTHIRRRNSTIHLNNTTNTSIGGFDGVLGVTSNNQEVYSVAMQPQLQQILLNGGTTTLFCYGYTGSGKSHTCLGYGSEKGLVELAGEELLQWIQNRNNCNNCRIDTDENELLLTATVCELYQNKAYDILDEQSSTTNTACTLREDAAGQLRILGPPTTVDLKDVLPDIVNCDKENLVNSDQQQQPETTKQSHQHATVVLQRQGLTARTIRTRDDLQAVLQRSAAARSVGTSTEHTQSSRSHAVMEFRITTTALRAAQESLEQAESLLPALLNALDNSASQFFRELIDETSTDANNPHAYKLRQYHEPHEWQRRFDALQQRQQPLYQAVIQAKTNVQQAQKALAQRVAVEQFAGIGAKLVLVDLAGADYDHRGSPSDAAVQKESIAINQSLLALKECLRALSSTNTTKAPPYRQSLLTRVLREALQPRSTSALPASSVMLVNVCPVARLERRTVNTLRYGQLLDHQNRTRASNKKKTSKTNYSTGSKPWLQDRRRFAEHENVAEHEATTKGE